MRLAIVCGALLLVLTGGCGNASGAGHADAGGADAGGPDAWGGPAAPVAPEPPALGPCPAGWRVGAASGSEPETCEPWPEAGAATCASGEAQFPGDPACAPVGDPCPVGDFPEDIAAGSDVLYVLAGAAPGGDGTLASPFSRIADATRVSRAGTIIAVGKGEYDEPVVLRTRFTLWGACAAQTRIASSVAATDVGTIDVVGPDSAIRNVTVGGERPGIIVAPPTASVHIHGVVIAGALGAGLGIHSVGTSTVDGLLVRDTRPLADGTFGRAIDLEEGSTLEARRVHLEHNVEFGVFAVGAGTSLVLEDAVIRDVRPSTNNFGRGLRVSEGASATLARVVVELASDVGISASRSGTTLAVEDVVVRDTRSGNDSLALARALDISQGASATVRRALFERNGEVGVSVGSAGTLVLEDLVLRDMQPRSDGAFGRAIAVQDGSTLELLRAVLARQFEHGVFVAAASASIEDLRVVDVGAIAADGTYGRGIEVGEGATVSLARAVLESTHEVCVLVSDPGTTLDARDVAVVDAGARVADGLLGRGVQIQDEAHATFERLSVERVRELGVCVSLDGSAELTDARVSSVLPRDCASSTCPGLGGGTGFGVYVRGALTVGSFLVEDAGLAGLQIVRGGVMDVHDGLVTRCGAGANVQDPSFDVRRITQNVRYVDNVTTLDTTELPVPDVDSPL